MTCVKTSHTHEAMGGFNEHHVECTEEWPKREYPEQRQGHAHGNLGQRQWKERRHTGEQLDVRTVGTYNFDQIYLQRLEKMTQKGPGSIVNHRS